MVEVVQWRVSNCLVVCPQHFPQRAGLRKKSYILLCYSTHGALSGVSQNSPKTKRPVWEDIPDMTGLVHTLSWEQNLSISGTNEVARDTKKGAPDCSCTKSHGKKVSLSWAACHNSEKSFTKENDVIWGRLFDLGQTIRQKTAIYRTIPVTKNCNP